MSALMVVDAKRTFGEERALDGLSITVEPGADPRDRRVERCRQDHPDARRSWDDRRGFRRNLGA